MRRTRIGIAAVLAMVGAAPAAGGTGWSSVGSAKLESGAGTATAKLRWDSSYRELLVCTEGGAVKLGQAILHLGDGSTKSLRMPSRIASGACTPALSVRKLDIASIDFAYDSGAAGGATRLMLAGR